MAELSIDGDFLVVTLTTGEKVGGVHGNFRFPISSVVGSALLDDPITNLKGIRAPGAGFPNRKIGTWRKTGAKTYVSVTRGEPGIRLDLDGQSFDHVLMSVPNAAQIAAAVTPPTT